MIDLEDYISDDAERQQKGAQVDGEFAFIPFKNVYTIRRWQDGNVEDEGTASHLFD